MNYSNGKIYKITGGGMTYYGSTTQPLYKRFHQHKYKNSSSKIILETGEAVIVLVELFPCETKEQLFSRERWFIENNECVNKLIPNRKPKEYYEDNREHILQYTKNWYNENKNNHNTQTQMWYKNNSKYHNTLTKNWYNENKDKVKEKRSIKHTCNCGTICSIGNITHHNKTIKHQNWLKNK